MRKSTRTTKRRYLPTILHPRQLAPITNCHPPLAQSNRHIIPPHAQTLTPYTKFFLIEPIRKPSPFNSLHGKSPFIWLTPMTPQSPRRSSYRRLHTTSSPTPKTRRLRNHTNHDPSKPHIKQPPLPLHHPSLMRSPNNQCHLPTPNRPKIFNCLLFCQPHRTSCSRNHNPNPMSILRSYNSDNFPWPNLLNTILLSQH